MSEKKKPGRLKLVLPLAINILLAVICFLLGILALIFWKRTLPSLFWQAQFILWILLLTTLTRSLSLRSAAGFFLLGMGLIPLLSLLVSFPLSLVFGRQSQAFSDVFVPIIEETLKVMPLLVLAFIPRSRMRQAAGLTDFLLLGAVLGGGFNLIEDLLRGWTWAEMLAVHWGPHIGPFYLFPTLDLQGGIGLRDITTLRVVYLGHGASTAMIALAAAVPALYGNKGARRLLWLLPAGVWLWVTWDHAFYNLSSDGRLKPFLDTLHLIFGLRGNLAPWTLLLGGLAAVGFDAAKLIKYHRQNPDTAIRLKRLSIFRPFSVRHLPLQISFLFSLLRMRRAAAYASRAGEPPPELQRRMKLARQALEKPDR